MAAEHASKAILGIALILAGIYLLAAFWWSDFLILLKGTIPVILIASPGINPHELSHKFVPLSFGLGATFQIWTLGLFLGVVLKLFSSHFILLAPGYVSISQASQGIHTSLIAFAGPAVNLLLWLGARSILHSSRSFSQKQLLGLTLLRDINRWLFIFNIIPIPPLDGSKILGPLLFSFF